MDFLRSNRGSMNGVVEMELQKRTGFTHCY